MRVKNVVIAMLLLLVAITACNTGAKIEEGIVRDTIFSAEISRGGTWGIFMTHDDSVAYCTPDRELGEYAKELLLTHDGEVILEFKSKEVGKDTEGKVLGSDQCQKYCSGTGESYWCFNTVILQSIRPVAMRTGEYRG